MRQEEMIFLGMTRKPKTEQELAVAPEKIAEKERKTRKIVQEDYWATYQKDKEDLIENIKEVEGDEIVDAEMKKRRDWIQKYRS